MFQTELKGVILSYSVYIHPYVDHETVEPIFAIMHDDKSSSPVKFQQNHLSFTFFKVKLKKIAVFAIAP